MFRVVICDDEDIFIDILKGYISTIFKQINEKIEVITFKSGEELLASYPEGVDIFFLDIQMHGLSGMDVARKMREFNKNSEIIFTTAIKEYALEGYEVRAYRYLIKPIDFEDFKKHILSCIDHIKSNSKNSLLLELKNESYRIRICDITYIEVINKDLSIYTIDSVYRVRMSMNKIEKELLKYKFFRCHKSYLVNMNHIKTIRGKFAIISNKEIPISRSKENIFREQFASVLGEILC